jgi:hypothetical protein
MSAGRHRRCPLQFHLIGHLQYPANVRDYDRRDIAIFGKYPSRWYFSHTASTSR